jgi:hypothetical protein
VAYSRKAPKPLVRKKVACVLRSSSANSAARVLVGYWARTQSKTLLRLQVVHAANDAAATAQVDVEAAIVCFPRVCLTPANDRLLVPLRSSSG